MFAQVVIDIRTRALHGVYTYSYSEVCFPRIVEGSAVLVRFRGRLVIGYVVATSHELDESLQGKEECIMEVLDALDDPFFGGDVIELALFIQRTYGGSLIEAFSPFISLSGHIVIDEEGDKPRLKLLRPTLRFESRYTVTEGADDRSLSPSAHKQRAVLEALRTGSLPRSAIQKKIEGAGPVLNSLVKKGLISEEENAVLVSRSEVSEAMFWESEKPDTEKSLNAEQATALATLKESLGSHETFVLDGVTGSGKTEIYLQLIAEVLKRDESDLVLIPEISLTFQTVRRFAARFPNLVAVIHSRLSDSEKKAQLELIMTGQARVLIGARSALFAQMQNLGLIIIDEEHDDSYKQGSPPRYHARDVANKCAELKGIPLVLGSATPSFSSIYKVEQGIWRSIELKKRINNKELPEVTLIDMAEEFRKKSYGIFSHELIDALKQVYENKEKAMLLLNRRGTASFFLCRDCGYVPKCRDCSTSLTYHANSCHLRCHTCDLIEPVPAQCPDCGSAYLKQMGAGTQHIQEALNALFPEWSIIRMDADSTKSRGGHEEVLRLFEAEESAVLIGTQMIAKGHDFPSVTLVGVIVADIGLHFSDFRAGEVTYQLLEQVSGRAGRAELAGRVLIQTYLPDHPVLQAVKAHNREIFYKLEMQMRKELGYPPFRRLANIVASAYKEQDAVNFLQALKARISSDEKLREVVVLGPTSSLFTRIKGRYRHHIVIKAPADFELGGILNDHISKNKAPLNLQVALDVDPMSLV